MSTKDVQMTRVPPELPLEIWRFLLADTAINDRSGIVVWVLPISSPARPLNTRHAASKPNLVKNMVSRVQVYVPFVWPSVAIISFVLKR